jgi:WD40 repeat protein
MNAIWTRYFGHVWPLAAGVGLAASSLVLGEPPQRRDAREGHTDLVTSVAFSPDGKTLASGSHDQTVKLWNVADGTFTATLPRRTGFVRSVAFSPDGKLLASGDMGSMINLWDVAGGKTAVNFKGRIPVFCVAFGPDSETIAAGQLDGAITLLDATRRNQIAGTREHAGAVICLAFSPDGKFLASGSMDKTIKLWDVVPAKEAATLEGRPVIRLSSVGVGTRRKPATLVGHSDIIHSLAISPDGKTLASASGDRTIKLWNIADGTVRATLEGHTGFVRCVTFSPDGKTLASGSADRTIKLWDVSSGENTATLRGHSADVYCVAISNDGRTLATGGADTTIKLWDLASGTNTATFGRAGNRQKSAAKPQLPPRSK